MISQNNKCHLRINLIWNLLKMIQARIQVKTKVKLSEKTIQAL
jgi:hypothetical protein